MYIRTIQYYTTVDKNLKKQFAAYHSYTAVTFKQGQDHQTLCDLLDPMQGYNKAKFEQPHLKLNSVHEKANNKVFVKSGNMSIISFEYMYVKVKSGSTALHVHF